MMTNRETMITDDLNETMRANVMLPGWPWTNVNYSIARDAVLAFLCAPLPCRHCGFVSRQHIHSLAPTNRTVRDFPGDQITRA